MSLPRNLCQRRYSRVLGIFPFIKGLFLFLGQPVEKSHSLQSAAELESQVAELEPHVAELESQVAQLGSQSRGAASTKDQSSDPVELRTSPSRFSILRGAILIGGLAWATCLGATRIPPEIPSVLVGGQRYVTLKNVAKHFGFKTLAIGSKSIELRSKWTIIRFEPGSRRAQYNHSEIWLNAGVKKIGKDWAVAHADYATTLDPLLRPFVHLRGRGNKIIVIDPGHGGTKAGTISKRKTMEKTVALQIATRTASALKSAGYQVFLTRSGDSTLGLETRTDIAKRRKADLFISIHCNSSGAGTAKGLETYVISIPGFNSTNNPGAPNPDRTVYPGNRNANASYRAAMDVQQAMLSKTKAHDRGLKRARFSVLKTAPCPAMLIECGFLDHRSEEANLKSASYQTKLAQGILSGVNTYMERVRQIKLVR